MLKLKNIVVFGFILFMISSLSAQSDSFYYIYRNQRIELFPLKDQLTVEFKTNHSPNRMQEILRKHFLGFKMGDPAWRKRMPLIYLSSPLSQGQLLNLLNELKNDPEIVMATPVFRRFNSRVRQTINRTFIVRFHENVSRQTINQLNQSVGAEVVKQLLDNTFLLRMKINTKWNGLQAANYYSELPEVKYAQPNFIYLNWETLNYDVNDPLWPQQWAHKNTGQSVVTATKDNSLPDHVNGYPDADIDADQAWDVLINHGLSAGGSPDILVAFLDSGVDLDHPDLADNLFSPGVDYTPDNGSDANDVQGHGTSTAGIVAASGDNGLGVAGIAFRSKILPLKVFTLYGSAEDAGYAEAMDYAWQHGADVISNSWSGTSPSQLLEDAIQRAKTQGRNGKGCVVVFSSGNGGSGHVSYPGYLENVIAVGASNMFDEKKNPGSQAYQRRWGGNYGTALDLVAPTIVYTTDIVGSNGYVDGDYFDHFGGTSAACPHVSGVAALVLAADSNLTADQVKDILQRSADKIDLYAFDENGWNEHVGYGRVNAYNAS
ncbi:MAG: S8 family serine peptidase [Caldisericaceae bacterium]|nr:S8 family serine peptidase [Caldisericaceae bacterium]